MTTTDQTPEAGRLKPAELRPWWVVSGVLAVVVAGIAGLVLGPAQIGTWDVLVELVDRLPFIDTESGLGERQQAIIWEIRLPRVVLGLLVGAMLATAGGAYQGVFRNPLADPYLLGVAAGAGFGATVAIVSGLGDGIGIIDPIPMMAFAGALVAVVLTYLVGATGGRLDPVTSLVLAGVAVASFFTAIQTFVQQRHSETIRQVYFFVLGQLRTAGWDEVTLLAPYTGVCLAVILAVRRRMDTLAEGAADLDVAVKALADLDAGPLADRTVDTLSGGERQRIVIARSLAQESPVLLLDEPTTALDVGHQQEVLDLVDRLRAERNLTVLATMHDLTLAGQYADWLVVLDAGEVVVAGSADEVLTEEAVARHYGARVRVVPDEAGPIVVPVRRSGSDGT